MALLVWSERTDLGISGQFLLHMLEQSEGLWRHSRGRYRFTSIDGRTWSQVADFGSDTHTAMAYANGTWLCVGWLNGFGGRIERSTDDGATWSALSPGTSGLNAVGYGNGVWVVAGALGVLYTSTDDGLTWTARTSGFAGTRIDQVRYLNGVWLAIGLSGKLSTSSDDGVTWTLRTTGTTSALRDPAYALGAHWVCIGAAVTQILKSTDNGTTWTLQTTAYDYLSRLFADTSGLYACAFNGRILRTVDGINWTAQQVLGTSSVMGIVRVGSDGLVAINSAGAAVSSADDGVTWSIEYTYAPGPYTLIAAGGGEAVISTEGTALWSAPYTELAGPPVVSTPWPVEVVELRAVTGWSVDVVAAPELRASCAWRVTVAAAQQAATDWPVQILDAARVAGLDGAASWAAAPDGRWEAVVWLGNDNISARIFGAVSVQIEADAARTAEFAFVPAAPIQPLGLIGQRVRIAFAQAGGLNAQTIFRGVVETPTIDLQTGVITCACHDQAQEVWSNTPRETIAALVGGRWHVAVSGEPEDSYEYLRERIQSVGASWALDANQAPRILPWASPARTVTVRQADVLDGSLAVDLPSREQLRTRIDVRMQYRYPVHRGRGISAQWAQPLSFFLPRITETMTKQAYIMPDVGMVESAADNPPGWERVALSIEHPPAGTWNVGTELQPAIYNISQLVAPSLAIGFSGTYLTRWQQTVTEDYSIAVVWDALEAQIGQPVGEEIGATLESTFDSRDWGSDPSVEPQISVAGVGDVSQPYYAPGAAPADRDEVLRTLLDRAWVRLWSASRTGRVRFALPCRPDLWLDTGCILEGGRVRASGVIVALEHVLDVDAGRATTDIAVAVGMPGATPAALPAWSLPASPYTPALPSLGQLSATIGTYVGGLASSPPFDAETMIGLITNEDGAEVPGRNYYPVGLTIGWPDLTADDRDPRELEAAAVVSVTVPTDLLEIT